jgi:hypothetical protein
VVSHNRSKSVSERKNVIFEGLQTRANPPEIGNMRLNRRFVQPANLSAELGLFLVEFSSQCLDRLLELSKKLGGFLGNIGRCRGNIRLMILP